MIKYVYIILACAVISLSAFVAADTPDTAAQEKIVAMRTIGHELLLASGDSTSRVLPVQQLSENEFEIRFEKPIAIKADALVGIIDKYVKTGLMPKSYVTTVNSCADKSIYYAYRMPLQKGASPPCIGRALPKGCYYIHITLKRSTSPIWLSAGAVPLLLFMGWRFKKKKSNATELVETEYPFIKIGAARYYPALQKIKVSNQYVTLTGKEAQVLSIFAASINIEVSRERLQKEVWEDEGVIVGRSLDVFISKLRKKFIPEPGIQIVSIHGKGYKLMVEDI
jgi:hypothetical protein